MQMKRKRVPEGLESKLNAVTNQLLDLGKRNRLLNYQDKGLKTLKLLNKNTEEIFRGVKGYRDLKFFDTDAALNEFINNPEILAADKKGYEDLLHLTYEQVYGVTRKYLQRNEILCYKAGYQLVRALKSLFKDMSSSMIEKGINPLYISFGFIHYTENDGETIGLLFCKEKNDLVAQWTVEKSEQPIAITRYELEKLMPKTKMHLTNKE